MQVVIEGSTTKNVFKEVARLRREDAALLRAGSRLLGGIYLLGYSVECRLKYAACERNGWNRLPKTVRIRTYKRDIDLYTHDRAILVDVAGLSPTLHSQRSLNALYAAISEKWSPEIRYRAARFPPKDGPKLYNDLSEFYEFLVELAP